MFISNCVAITQSVVKPGSCPPVVVIPHCGYYFPTKSSKIVLTRHYKGLAKP